MNATKRALRRMRRELLETREALAKSNREARTDDLTGLWNKRAWRESIVACTGAGITFSVVLFDLANLKAANRALGHEQADWLLRDVCRHIRSGDQVGHRIGGDEFAVLLPNVDRDDALLVRDRIESAVGLRPLRAGLDVFLVGDVLTWTPHGPSITALLTRADFDLEQRKREKKRALGQPESREAALQLLG